MLEFLPKDWRDAHLVGRMDFGQGPTPVALKDGLVFDLSALAPTVAQLLDKHADNYHRWFGTDWAFIELCGPTHRSDWSVTAEARVKRIVDYGHGLGYLVSFYSINGFNDEQNQGWTPEFNFGSREAASVRWNAAIQAHADFIATDQYEDVAELVRSKR